MGCFGGNSPSYSPPPAPRLRTAEELFGSATNWARTNNPLAYGAREGALADINRPEFYSGFQPTSMEQALGSQYFQNIMPDIEKSIKHNLSLSGMASSPILSRQIARERGQVGYDVGKWLSDQGNQRAQYSLGSRLAIDPASVYGPYLNTDTGQSNSQAQYDYDAAQQQAQANYYAAS